MRSRVLDEWLDVIILLEQTCKATGDTTSERKARSKSRRNAYKLLSKGRKSNDSKNNKKFKLGIACLFLWELLSFGHFFSFIFFLSVRFISRFAARCYFHLYLCSLWRFKILLEHEILSLETRRILTSQVLPAVGSDIWKVFHLKDQSSEALEKSMEN